MDGIIPIAIILGCTLITYVNCTLDDHPDSFWISAELLSVQWRKNCLTTAGCAEPRFQVTKLNGANNQAISTSWPVVLKLVEHGSHLFISHWSSGSSNDISIKCEVIGLDPAYRFPRICDTTETHRIFSDQKVMSQTVEDNFKPHKSVLEIAGKCFNASLAMQHYDHCPTCIQHQSVAVVEHYSDSESIWEFWSGRHGGDQFLYALFVLCILTALISTAFACLFVAYLHQKRRLRHSTSGKLRLQTGQLSTINRPNHHPYSRTGNSNDESKYEIPWEQIQGTHRTPRRPILSGRTSLGPHKSMEVPLAFGDPTISNLNGMIRPDFVSPNNLSFSERHDDSGLDSV